MSPWIHPCWWSWCGRLACTISTGKGAKESSLFIFWVNLCLQNGSCWKDQFILGIEQWRWEMGEGVFWRGAATINKQAQPGIFQKDTAPLYKTPFSGQTLARRCKAGEDLLQGSCSNVLKHLHHSQELLMGVSHEPNPPHWKSLLCSALLSPSRKRLVLRTSTLSHLKHTSRTSEHCFGYVFMLEIRTKWTLEGPKCCMKPAGQDWHCSVTEVRLWPLTWKHKTEFSPHFPPPECSLLPYMAALYYDPFK